MKIQQHVQTLKACLITLAPMVCVPAQANEGNFIFDASSPHHFSVLLGNTHLQGEVTEFTVGLDYEYRVNQPLGIGAVVEYAGGELDTWTYLLVADIHFDHLIVQVGPGVEHSSEHDLFTFRVGALYEFEWDVLTISPQLHYDYHDGGRNSIIYGLAFGFHF